MKQKDNIEELKRFEKKDLLWKEVHVLFDTVLEHKTSLREVVKKMLQLTFIFLEKYHSQQDLKEIIITFENLKDNILATYGQEAVELYGRDDINEIMGALDSRIFEYDYEKEIHKLKNNLKKLQELEDK